MGSSEANKIWSIICQIPRNIFFYNSWSYLFHTEFANETSVLTTLSEVTLKTNSQLGCEPIEISGFWKIMVEFTVSLAVPWNSWAPELSRIASMLSTWIPPPVQIHKNNVSLQWCARMLYKNAWEIWHWYHWRYKELKSFTYV